jgi:hypothetical protein
MMTPLSEIESYMLLSKYNPRGVFIATAEVKK